MSYKEYYNTPFTQGYYSGSTLPGKPGSGWSAFYNNYNTGRLPLKVSTTEYKETGDNYYPTVYSGTGSSYSEGKEEIVSSQGRSRTIAIVAVLVLFLLAVTGVLIWYILRAPDPVPTTPPISSDTHLPVSLTITRTDLPYSDQLKNPNSPLYKAYEQSTCSQLKVILQQYSPDVCTIYSMRGAAGVVQDVLIQVPKPDDETREDIFRKIKELLQKASDDMESFFLGDYIKLNYCKEDDNICNHICSEVPLDCGPCDICACESGFLLGPDNRTCHDVNECQAENGDCEQQCFNHPGYHLCGCNTGYQLEDNGKTCKDVDECREKKSCQYACGNTAGSFTCSCPTGYQLDGNGVTCSDKDECTSNPNLCEQICENTPASFKCSCLPGYILDTNGRDCIGGGFSVEISPEIANLTVKEIANENDTDYIQCRVVPTGRIMEALDNDLSKVKVRWLKAHVPLDITADYNESSIGITLVFDKLLKSDQGRYYCVVESEDLNLEIYTLAQIYVTGCYSYEFECKGDGSCLNWNRRCDQKVQCPDGSDEQDCGCHVDEYTCDNGKCLNPFYLCDGYNDCGDWSDETYPNCTQACVVEGYKQCDMGLCLRGNLTCDGIPDCPDESDELLCTTPDCDSDLFQCGSRCISSTLLCDGIAHCVDRTDEQGCPTGSCFECGDGSGCVRLSDWCTGVVQCEDGTDEPDRCDQSTDTSRFCRDSPCMLRPSCQNSTTEKCVCPHPYELIGDGCILSTLICDGIVQITDGRDEPTGCSNSCPRGSFSCDRKCVSDEKRCDGIRHCRDKQDEHNCECSAEKGLLECSGSDGRCVPVSVYCDFQIDCPAGEDEPAQCTKTCPAGFYKCTNLDDQFVPWQPECVSLDLVCDGKQDCNQKSDEYQCECEGDLVSCADRLQCISAYGLCDEYVYDCQDRSDEISLCRDVPCSGGFFKCDEFCVSEDKFCDGVPDCADGKDELPMCLAGCGPGRVFCDGRCLSSRLVCDEKIDCLDATDEIGCTCSEAQCDMGMCVAAHRLCDFDKDCPDGSDEINCTAPCSSDFLECDGHCLSKDLVCDGTIHCSDWSDEIRCAAIDDCNPDTTPKTYRKYVYVYDSLVARFSREKTFHTACSMGMCISMDSWCDGVIDCPDGTDEYTNCSIGCPDGTFKCASGEVCIPMKYRCDDLYDCVDRSDEYNCEKCPSMDDDVMLSTFGKLVEYKRCNNTECIVADFFCNGEVQCSDGSDEDPDLCLTTDKFQCLDGAILPLSRVCNRFGDCNDNSDEILCPTPPPECPSFTFVCENSKCVYPEVVCNRINDCGDWSDETQDCPCLYNERHCDDGLCIDKAFFCDGIPQCQDGSDETGCDECGPDQVQCKGNNYCVNVSSLCDGAKFCADWSDEALCECGEDEFMCADVAVCRPNRYWCDRAVQCPYGADEKPGCGQACKPGQLACDGQCVSQDKQCDGIQHCADSSDEIGCDCRWGTFRCNDGSLCVNQKKLCDGNIDCRDSSDEQGCSQLCHAGEYLCGDQCRPVQFICDFPHLCPEIKRDLDCSTLSEPFPGVCGVPRVRPAPQVIPLIVGGEEAVPNSFPWFVVIEQDLSPVGTGAWRFICGGSILSENWIITAAHCMISPAYRLRIRAGESDLTVTSRHEQIRRVAEYFSHESFIDFYSYNIALMRVDIPLELNDYVSPVCLSKNEPQVGEMCTLTGFGLTLGTQDAMQMNQVSLPVLDQAVCQDWFYFHDLQVPLHESVMCAGYTERRAFFCSGDSGGPLVSKQDGVYVLTGIVSYGMRGCQYYKGINAFTRVGYFSDWIYNISGVFPQK